MKKLFYTIILLIGIFSTTLVYEFYAYYGPSKTIGKVHKIEKVCKTSKCLKEEKQKKLILAALVSRCSKFGWKTESNIASCVKQEAYRDLQIQEQEFKLKILEEKMLSSNSNNPVVIEERPFFLEILDFYIEEAENKNNAQLRKDIMLLKTQNASLQSQRQTQAALDSLYRDN